MTNDPQQLREILKTLEDAALRKRFRKLDFYVPYPKQREFHRYGATKRERLLMAGNQQGKTYSGAAETAFHMTGLYPPDWEGRMWDRATKGWICGESSTLVRDTQQRLLCGTPGVDEDFGTGLIPKECFADKPSLARGVTDAFDTIQVRHISGGISTATFKSYEQGRQKFQAATLDWEWLDEEPDEDIYQECLARITATGGMMYMTFTPLKGRSKVVIRFMDEPSIDRQVINMRIEDAEHIPASERQKIIDGYLAHEREARVKGIPILGSGAIFTMPEDSVIEDQLQYIPDWWVKLWGIDFGIGHPFGAALILWDRDPDVIHVHFAFKHKADMEAKDLPVIHASMMKTMGVEVPVAWPQDGTQRDKGSGVALAAQYKAAGLKMHHEHATWPDGGNSTEAGIKEMQDREATGRLKYSRALTDLLNERRYYHRKDGQLVKLNDDILSAVRVAIMMKRFAKPVQLGSKKSFAPRRTVAQDVDFDVF